MSIQVAQGKLQIPVLKGQMRFSRSKARQAAITSGLGGGKSFALRLWSLNQCIKYPRALHCYGSLSYRNMKDSAIPAFGELCDCLGIPYRWFGSDYYYEINGKTHIIFRSQDAAVNMRSTELGSLACDELAYWSEKNFKTMLGRLRDSRGSLHMRAATTTNGYNFFHRYFVKEAQGTQRDLIFTSSYENKYLPEDYLTMLEESYDEDMQAQEIRGQFVNIGGRRYYKYSQDKHSTNLEIIRTIPIVVGMDFNVNPMTAVICQVHEDGDKPMLHVVDEIWLKNSNTWNMADEIMRRYGPCFIVPDAAGNRLQSNATRTDHQILREAGHEVARVRNPHRKDRFNTTNNLLEKGRILIDKKCEKLMWDLGCCSTDDSDDKESGHITDALGYVLWYYFPISIRGNESYSDVPTIL
jgi:phage terminase large subunit